ncbi:MAG: peptidylprolyl isomerase [Ignavibacteriaceae bacterium]|nr:peptidylprolyl isomerase [Ignavibacteriaceae bacterium]
MRFLFLGLLIIATSVYPQQVIDRIVAVVDNEIILGTELDFQLNLLAAQRRIDPQNPEARQQVLNNLIDEKLVYAQALIDSVFATEEEVTRQIDYQIEMFIQQYGSKERLEQTYGMSIDRIKRELRENIRKDIMVQKLQEKKFGFVESSRREVESFFETYKDSLGVIPEKVKISHIFRNPQAAGNLKEKYKAFARNLLDSIKAGADFAELAKSYSDHTESAKDGGDLGFVKKGFFFPEYEAAAFALDINQISDIVESPAGFHIIQLLEKRGESVRTRQILIKIKADEQTDLQTIEFLTDLRDTIMREGRSFYDMAKLYSDDKETAPFGGVLGTFYMEQLDKNLLDISSKLQEGEISFPKRVNVTSTTYGYHIVFLEKRIPQHKPNLEMDYTDLKKLSDEFKKQKLYAEWIKELRTKIYWEIKI